MLTSSRSRLMASCDSAEAGAVNTVSTSSKYQKSARILITTLCVRPRIIGGLLSAFMNPGSPFLLGIKPRALPALALFLAIVGLSSREPVTFSIFSCFYTPNRMFFNPPQRRHPERSAAQIYRITDSLWRGVEGPRRCLCADVLPSFPATNYRRNQKSHNLRGNLQFHHPLAKLH